MSIGCLRRCSRRLGSCSGGWRVGGGCRRGRGRLAGLGVLVGGFCLRGRSGGGGEGGEGEGG